MSIMLPDRHEQLHRQDAAWLCHMLLSVPLPTQVQTPHYVSFGLMFLLSLPVMDIVHAFVTRESLIAMSALLSTESVSTPKYCYCD